MCTCINLHNPHPQTHPLSHTHTHIKKAFCGKRATSETALKLTHTYTRTLAGHPVAATCCCKHVHVKLHELSALVPPAPAPASAATVAHCCTRVCASSIQSTRLNKALILPHTHSHTRTHNKRLSAEVHSYKNVHLFSYHGACCRCCCCCSCCHCVRLRHVVPSARLPLCICVRFTYTHTHTHACSFCSL